MRYEIRPLGHWTDPETTDRRSGAAFRAAWADTLDLLGYETEKLSATMVVLQVDVIEGEIRRGGMLRASARVGHPGVVVSFDSEVGPLRYVTDAFDSWKSNVRAIALALVALRAVDRYGVTSRSEQYLGFRALPAGGTEEFASADHALRWMREQAGDDGRISSTLPPKGLYKLLALRMHPDVTGSQERWNRLDAARQLLDGEGLL